MLALAGGGLLERENGRGEMTVERIVALLGEPVFASADGASWDVMERDSGLTYPADFRAFLDLYGPGTVNAVRFKHPSVGRNLLASSVLSDIDFLGPVFDRGDLPMPLGRSEGHLLPFAHVTSGVELLFRVTAASADEWHVCAYAGDVAEFVDFGCCFEEWLCRYLQGDEEIEPWIASCGAVPPRFTSAM